MELSNLRQAAEQALEALEWSKPHADASITYEEAITALRAALAEPEQEPLTEEEIEKAYRHIWRNIPADFDHTSMGWIEQGIRYAEQAHGIKGEA